MLDLAVVQCNTRVDVQVVDVWEAGVDHRVLVASVWVAGNPPPAGALADKVSGW